MMLKSVLWVGLGGGIGSILRFLTSYCMEKYHPTAFPLATFMINILGCFIIGLLIGVIGHQINHPMRLLFVTGFCGGFTTFSTFAAENLILLQNGNYRSALTYILLSTIGGVMAVWFGLKIVQ